MQAFWRTFRRSTGKKAAGHAAPSTAERSAGLAQAAGGAGPDAPPAAPIGLGGSSPSAPPSAPTSGVDGGAAGAAMSMALPMGGGPPSAPPSAPASTVGGSPSAAFTGGLGGDLGPPSTSSPAAPVAPSPLAAPALPLPAAHEVSGADSRGADSAAPASDTMRHAAGGGAELPPAVAHYDKPDYSGVSLARLEEECRAMESQIRETKSMKERLGKSLSELNGRRSKSIEELAEVNQQILHLQETGEAGSGTASAAREEVNSMSEIVKKLEAEVHAAMAEDGPHGVSQRMRSEYEELHTQVLAARQTELESSREAAATAQHVAALRHHLEEVQTRERDSMEEIERLKASVAEAKEAAQSWQDLYWSDAPFLEATQSDVERARATLDERKAMVKEMEAAVALQRTRVEEAQARNAFQAEALRSDVASAATPLLTSPCTQVAAAHGFEHSLSLAIQGPSDQNLAGVSSTAPASMAGGGQSGLAASIADSLPGAASSRRLLSSERIALSAVEEDNDRLRKRIAELRGALQQQAAGGPSKVWLESDAGHEPATLPKTQNPLERANTHVVLQLKQALQDDLSLLRTLHAKKQSLDRQYHEERRLRVAAERRLIATESAASR